MTVRINQTSYANRVDRGPLGAANAGLGGLRSTRGYACAVESRGHRQNSAAFVLK